MDPFAFAEKQLILTYASEVCKQLNQIVENQCCGCKDDTNSSGCLMLTEDEKIEVNFDLALKNVILKIVNDKTMANMSPFRLSYATKIGLESWLRSDPISSRPDLQRKIKGTVKIIGMY